MKEKTFDGLTIRKLKTKDAANFVKISTGLGMSQYLAYFRARNVSEAESIIAKNNRYGYALYGLFVRRVGLVSVFYVSPDSSAPFSSPVSPIYLGCTGSQKRPHCS